MTEKYPEHSLGNEFKLLIEIRGIYDGWSVGVRHDDTLVNRWPEDHFRHAATQKWIEDEIIRRENKDEQ